MDSKGTRQPKDIKEQAVRITIDLSPRVLTGIEDVRLKMGLKSRSLVVQRLLEELILGD